MEKNELERNRRALARIALLALTVFVGLVGVGRWVVLANLPTAAFGGWTTPSLCYMKGVVLSGVVSAVVMVTSMMVRRGAFSIGATIVVVATHVSLGPIVRVDGVNGFIWVGYLPGLGLYEGELPVGSRMSTCGQTSLCVTVGDDEISRTYVGPVVVAEVESRFPTGLDIGAG